uniref:Uncharacterized protein n=1 Tax=Arundo donax TaxID=35708 RepID=A0A0A9DCR8_ARUDO
MLDADYYLPSYRLINISVVRSEIKHLSTMSSFYVTHTQELAGSI